MVGEPGAGKSVALRHLALQLAKKGRDTKEQHAKIPLYINLREIPADLTHNVTADSIKEFVLDNIRRGDSDTTTYVRENWDLYRENGTWIFLFDSFDEIPAVLHAEYGSSVTKEYSEAIRQFLEGMGECKGVLASREFKGPEALAWNKFKILPLSEDKQAELVSNALLTPEQESTVLRHIGHSSVLASTPLFLSLLCRYVKENKNAPSHDYDLLSNHINRLANKDRDYIKRKYSLTPDDVLLGAEYLAKLFAESPSLGLAPTLDQITQLIDNDRFTNESIGTLVSALVDCKIGRADVPNARHGDRRFAFAHRRYQESLFVRYITKNPNHIKNEDLLLDPRWREYAVTLLQTQPLEYLQPVINTAIGILKSERESCAAMKQVSIMDERCTYFEWSNEVNAFALMELLQEGLKKRIEAVPVGLSNAIYDILCPRWEEGDSLDRTQVLRLGALLPAMTLTKYLTRAFKSGTDRMKEFAFLQTPYMRSSPSDFLKETIIRRLSDDVMCATSKGELNKLDALSSRLSKDFSSVIVFKRSAFLKKMLFEKYFAYAGFKNKYFYWYYCLYINIIFFCEYLCGAHY